MFELNADKLSVGKPYYAAVIASSQYPEVTSVFEHRIYLLDMPYAAYITYTLLSPTDELQLKDKRINVDANDLVYFTSTLTSPVSQLANHQIRIYTYKYGTVNPVFLLLYKCKFNITFVSSVSNINLCSQSWLSIFTPTLRNLIVCSACYIEAVHWTAFNSGSTTDLHKQIWV